MVSLCRHRCKHKSSLLLFTPFPSWCSLTSCLKGGLFSSVGMWLLAVFFTCPIFVALYQSAGSISFWLINVPFEVYYEPPGFNYYTITQSIPCHFIFMAFIMPLYVQSPNFILEEFHLISWVLYHSSHLSRVLFISVLCVYSPLWFFTSLTLCTYFFSFSWDALFFCSWKLLLKFLQTFLRTVFSLLICYAHSYLVAPFELLGIVGPSEGLEVWLFSLGHTMDISL